MQKTLDQHYQGFYPFSTVELKLITDNRVFTNCSCEGCKAGKTHIGINLLV
jgi:hypothetical protein